VLVNLAVAIVLGGTGMSDIALLAHQGAVFGDPPSDSTVHRTLAALDEPLLRRIAAVRARVRAHGGTCWRCARAVSLAICGRQAADRLDRIDIDATLITSHSAKTGAAVTFKKGSGSTRCAVRRR
jgi:hypothetical protein